MIGLSLMRAFAKAGWDTGFAGFVKPERWIAPEIVAGDMAEVDLKEVGGLWLSPRVSMDADAASLAKLIAEWKPDIVYCYGFEAAALANRVDGDFTKVATFYDPPHASAFFKRRVELQYGSPKVRLNILRRLPDLMRRWRRHFRQELPELAKTDVLISHSYNHGVLYQKRLKRPLLYFPNPLEPVVQAVSDEQRTPPAFLMAGAINTTVSLTGLYFLARKVLPHLRKDLEDGKLQIRVIGGGELRSDLAFLKEVPNIHFLGFISHEALMEEYARAVALLVPTPIRLGFRTRIVDAFRHGLPTIVHSANRAGFHELENRRNTMMSADGATLAAMMRELRDDRGLRDRIAVTALQEFHERYSADVFCKFVIDACAEPPKDFLR
jgi:glycosyltransferase involved in cell wall biosynthesis